MKAQWIVRWCECGESLMYLVGRYDPPERARKALADYEAKHSGEGHKSVTEREWKRLAAVRRLNNSGIVA